MRRTTASVTSTDATTAAPGTARNTIRRVLPYLWPPGQAWVKRRVVVAMILLVAARLISVVTPFFYKEAVDVLGQGCHQSGHLPDAGRGGS